MPMMMRRGGRVLVGGMVGQIMGVVVIRVVQ